MPQENKYEKLPKSMYPQVRQQIVDRIATFEKVIEDHAEAQKKALKMVYEQLEEAQNDLKYLDDEVKVKYIGEKYCSSKICLSTLLAGRLGHNDESSTGSGGGWHRDSYSQQFKSILYLTNVTERNGPFQYIKKSHLRSNIRKILTMRALDHEGGRITRYTEADIDLILSKFDYTIKTCTGGIGTLIFADTRGIHRGYPIENGERFSLTTYYTPKRVGVSDEILALNDHTIKKFRNSKFMNNSNHL